MNIRRASFLSIAPILAVAFSSCGDDGKQADGTKFSEEMEAATDPFDCLFKPIPGKEAAVNVAASRLKKPGERILVCGRILGAERLFEKEQAMFLMADPVYVTPDEDSPHPYRASGVPPAVKRAHMLSVQVLDRDGKLATGSLQGHHGLKEMAFVVVSGVMNAETTASSPVIDACAIEIVDAWPMEAPSRIETETYNPWGSDGTSCPTCVEASGTLEP